MVNKGKWLDAGGQPFQMASEKHIEALSKPAYPGVIDGYGARTLGRPCLRPPPRADSARRRRCGAGLLTWLNTDMKPSLLIQ